MKTRTSLALLLATILPVALTARDSSGHNRSSHSNNSWHSSSSRGEAPVSVPDTASTLLLLGAGLGGLLLMKQRLAFRTQ